MILSVLLNLKTCHEVDYVQAFPQADFPEDETIFMEIPDGYTEHDILLCNIHFRGSVRLPRIVGNQVFLHKIHVVLMTLDVSSLAIGKLPIAFYRNNLKPHFYHNATAHQEGQGLKSLVTQLNNEGRCNVSGSSFGS